MHHLARQVFPKRSTFKPNIVMELCTKRKIYCDLRFNPTLLRTLHFTQIYVLRSWKTLHNSFSKD